MDVIRLTIAAMGRILFAQVSGLVNELSIGLTSDITGGPNPRKSEKAIKTFKLMYPPAW